MRHPGDLPARRGHHLSNEGVQLLNKSNGKREWEQQTIYLPPALKQWLKVYSAQTHVEISEIVMLAVKEVGLGSL